jgi:aminoglycoside phosphotransferase (APT) family kinase protein
MSRVRSLRTARRRRRHGAQDHPSIARLAGRYLGHALRDSWSHVHGSALCAHPVHVRLAADVATVEAGIDVVALVQGDRVLSQQVDGRRRLCKVLGSDGWTEMDALQRACGDPSAVTVTPIRRLDTEPRRFLHVMAGTGSTTAEAAGWLAVANLDQLDEPDAVISALRLALDELNGQAPRPLLRPDWFRVGWLEEVESWIDARLADLGRRRCGASAVIKLWSLSAVVRTPYAGSNGEEGVVYFKATCEWFRAEPMITQTLGLFAHRHVPSVLFVDHDRAWMLMDPLPGVDSDNPPSLAVSAAEVLATVQLASLTHRIELERAGCPDRGLQATVDNMQLVINESIELPLLSDAEKAAVSAMESWLTSTIGEFYHCGLPITVGHGDLHLGNVASDGTRVALYDWTDACFTHPFLDAVHLAQSKGAGDGGDVLAAFSRIWRDAFPEADIDGALGLAPVVNKVFQAISYEGIYRAQEPAARWEMAGVVAGTLRELAEAYEIHIVGWTPRGALGHYPAGCRRVGCRS